MTWTISELAEQAAQVLAAAPQQANGRVRDVPNERLIRWYVTVGLVDPPLSRRGRVARYGERHLLQLVAVKRRQAQGQPLTEIQAELAGATDETLAAAAGLPVNADSHDNSDNNGNQPRPAPGPVPAVPARFWARPANPANPESPANPPGTPDQAATPEPAASQNGDAPALVPGLRLAPGVVLLLEGADRTPSPDDVTAILTAAQPLLKSLADRGLYPPGRPPNEEPEQGSLS